MIAAGVARNHAPAAGCAFGIPGAAGDAILHAGCPDNPQVDCSSLASVVDSAQAQKSLADGLDLVLGVVRGRARRKNGLRGLDWY
jgi:hypothetical protein